MIRLKTVPVGKLQAGNLVELASDPIARHHVNMEVFTPDVADRMKHEFGEVHKVERNSLAVVVLFQFGELRFPLNHVVEVFDED